MNAKSDGWVNCGLKLEVEFSEANLGWQHDESELKRILTLIRMGGGHFWPPISAMCNTRNFFLMKMFQNFLTFPDSVSGTQAYLKYAR